MTTMTAEARTEAQDSITRAEDAAKTLAAATDWYDRRVAGETYTRRTAFIRTATVDVLDELATMTTDSKLLAEIAAARTFRAAGH